MMRVWQSIVAGLALVLAGCTTTQEAQVSLQQAWIGRNVDQFFVQYGPPKSDFTMSDGGKIYEWAGGRVSYFIPASATTTTNLVGNYAYSNTQVFGGGNVTIGCDIRITATRDRTITAITPTADSLGRWQTSRCAEIFVR